MVECRFDLDGHVVDAQEIYGWVVEVGKYCNGEFGIMLDCGQFDNVGLCFVYIFFGDHVHYVYYGVICLLMLGLLCRVRLVFISRTNVWW